MSPRVIEPLSVEEQAAFDLVERLIRRDLTATTTHVQLVQGTRYTLPYVQILFGEPAIRWVAQRTLAEAFEAARAMWRRKPTSTPEDDDRGLT